jgi:hypothetical protein
MNDHSLESIVKLAVYDMPVLAIKGSMAMFGMPVLACRISFKITWSIWNAVKMRVHSRIRATVKRCL